MIAVVLILVIVVGVFILMLKSQIGIVEIKIDNLTKKIDALSKGEVRNEAKVAAKIEPIAYPEPEPEPKPEPEPEPIHYSDFEAKIEAQINEPEPEPSTFDEIINVQINEPEPEPVKIVEKPVVAPSEPKKEKNIEKYIGENLFGKIGILVLVVGVGLFVKYAIDNEWLSETMRTVLGFVVGGVLLFVAERLSKKYRMFSSLLAGGAFAIFYVTVAVAYHYYAIFSQPAAFIILVAITVAMIALSLLYNRRELAIISLVGGFTAPFIVSSGEGNYIVLFGYMAILSVGMFVLSIKKRWSELPIICFGATYLVMLIFTATSDMNYIGGGMLAFATLFYLIFLLPVVYILRYRDKINWTLLSIVVSNNFLYLAFGLYFLSTMPLTLNLDGVLTLFVAAVNLGLVMWIMRYHKDRRELVYSMLSLVLSFVSLTIPLQLEGNYITLFWATEMVVLLWLFIKSKMPLYTYFAMGMMALTIMSLMMDFVLTASMGMMFINATFATCFYTAICFVASGIIIARHREVFDAKGILPYNPFNIVMLAIGVLIAYVSILIEFGTHIFDGSLALGVNMIFSLLYLLLLAFLCGKRFGVQSLKAIYLVAIGLGLIFYIGNCFSSYNGLMFWALTASWAALTTYSAIKYLKTDNLSRNAFDGLMVYLNVVTTFVWVVVVNEFAAQIGIFQHSAQFSIALALLGTVQMVLGMKFHLRVLRIISVIVLSLVILKLAFFDLWLMNSAGKIVVFISFGAILLTLSFLYQKLKNVLFSKDEE